MKGGLWRTEEEEEKRRKGSLSLSLSTLYGSLNPKFNN
jgi:hypothetical protein